MPTDYTAVTPESVAAAAEAAITEGERLIATAAASVTAPSFDATLRPIELASAAVTAGYGTSAFMAHVHTEAAVRDAGQAAEERITKWRVGLAFREDLYAAVRAFADTPQAAGLEGESQRLLEHWLRDFRRAGFGLAADDRARLEALRARLVELEVAFQRNINEYRDGIELDAEGLTGLSEALVERLAPGSQPGTRWVSLDTPEYTPFLQQSPNRAAREELLRKKWNEAGAVNRPIFEEALGLRREIAELLGQPTWAHHCLEVKMAEEPGRVEAFYERIVPPLQAAARDELAALEGMLTADGEDGPLQVWDWLYYEDQIARTRHSVDLDEVGEYLPMAAVVEGMFALTGEVFGLDFREVEATLAWHPSVRLYEIHDRSSGELLASFYTDFFPREGKYNHAAAFPLVVGHRRADGGYERPVSAIVANLTPPSDTRPSLLRHGPGGEVETLFHEFGHILHMSITQAEFTRFSGAETELDFVEAPSQIMEHWTWEPSVLARFAKHWQTGEPIPTSLIERLVGARWLDVGLRATRQVFFGTLDLSIHGADVPDLDDETRRAFEVTGLPYPEGTFMIGGFGHLMGGYDCGYYGYLWAEVIGDDMWSRFADEGITSARVGGEYRRTILERGGAAPGDQLVRDFLGRDASVDGYLRMRGILAEAPA